MSLLNGLIRTAGHRPEPVQRAAPTPPPQPVAAPPVSVPAPQPEPAPVAEPSPIQNPHTSQPSIVDDFVLGYLDNYDQKPERSRDGGTNGYLHVSNLIKMECERRTAIMQAHGVNHWERVTGGHRIMWAQGRATEHHIRSGVIESRDGQGVYGLWKCKCENAHHLGSKPEPQYTCDRCQLPMDVYHEPTMFDDEYKITGSPDLSLILPQDYMLVTEIKSMTPDQFDELERPVADHSHQGLMYRDMYRRKGFKVHDTVVLLYGRKQFKWGGVKGRHKVYKEFHVDATSRLAVDMVESTYETADRIKRHVASQTFPERTICLTQDAKKAKRCPVAHLCFNMR